MIETELETIKNKLTLDDFDIKKTEKNLSKIEKKIISLENKFNSIINNSEKSENLENSENSEKSEKSEESDDIDDILENLKKLESDSFSSETLSIEKLIENYIIFNNKLNSIRIKNEDFKLKLEYL